MCLTSRSWASRLVPLFGLKPSVSSSDRKRRFWTLQKCHLISELKTDGFNQKEGPILKPNSSKLDTCQDHNYFYLGLLNSISKPTYFCMCGLPFANNFQGCGQIRANLGDDVIPAGYKIDTLGCILLPRVS